MFNECDVIIMFILYNVCMTVPEDQEDVPPSV